MGYINIFVHQPATMSIKNNQLVLRGDGEQIDYPLEDVNSVVIDNLATNISTYTLSRLAENATLTFLTDDAHLPCAIVLPFCTHFNSLAIYEYQRDLSRPLQKQIWKEVVKNKIKNQNEVLNICGGADDLKGYIKDVLSGDSSNEEAKASLVYFKKLFDKDFKRREDGQINSFLNYGYAIIRGFVARSVVAHGLLPFLGVNHKNKLNQYNLADDLMEPFRPIVDLYVKMYLLKEKELTPNIKAALLNIINYDVEIDGCNQTVSGAIDLLVESYIKSLKSKEMCLKEVKITGLNLHRYE